MAERSIPTRGLILDMDGVLWRADQPIGDLPAIFSEIARRGYRCVLATNNSTLSVDLYLQKLSRFGVRLESWQIVTSSQAAAQYLKGLFPQGGPVYLVGEIGLQEALEQEGFTIDAQAAQALVVGYDRQLTFEKLACAFRLLRRGVPFIGTNPDRTYPTPRGLAPGTGFNLVFLETATGVKPVIVGKPMPFMIQAALKRLGTAPEETLVVGDRLETDIACGQGLGCPTALVLSGVSSKEAAAAWAPPPDYMAPDLESLLALIRQPVSTG